jgi:hypothetical protein
MARVTGVTPGQLAGARREDAARVLAEILRRAGDAPPAMPALRPVPAAPRPAEGSQDSERFLAELLSGYPDDEIVRALGTRRGVSARVRVAEILEWLEVKARHEGRLENGTSAG